MIKKNILSLILLFVTVSITYAQVGINTENPNKLTELDIRNIINGNDTVPKGIMVPRMTETQRDQINVTENMTLANGLFIYNTDEDCFNYYSRTEGEWKSLCGSIGKSIFEIPNCSAISVKGKYASAVALDGSNYLAIPVHVTKVGKYTISAQTANSNGYYFYATGEFLSTGNLVINVPGVGTPTNFTPSGGNGDQLLVSINGVEACNNIYIKVIDSSIQPEYSLNCNTVSVNGTYIAGTNLTGTNTITLSMTANSTAAGAVYEISTDKINGMSFYGSGTLVAGTNNITLYGSGKPVTNGTYTFQLSTNSTISGGTSCAVNIKVASRNIRIMALTDNTGTAYYNIASSSSLLNQALRNPAYFDSSQTTTIPVAGFTFSQAASNPGNAITANNPDIIFLQYNYTPSSTADQQALANFVNNGGILIYGQDGDGATASRNLAAQALCRLIFNSTTMTVTGSNSTDNQQIQNTGTWVTNGPFMDLSGKYMGRDAGNNFDFNIDGFPYESATVIAFGSSSNNSIRAFMHNTKGFIFFGDGASFASNTGTDSNNWPAKFKITNSEAYAIPNMYSSVVTYNSHLFLNIMAWAINYTQKNRP